MKILLTGATGYIGQRLLSELARQGHQVVCLVRNPQRFHVPRALKQKVEIAEGDLLKPASLTSIPTDIDAAYYLVHSMSQNPKQFEDLEHRSATNFIGALKRTLCSQIVYLSGMTTDEKPSPHLRSRMAVEAILQNSGFNVTTLRAGVIVGSGSASFEIIRDLVEKLPVMVAPKWLNVPHQPIAIRDVIFYLTKVLGRPDCYNQSFDIGGPDVLTYKQMLLQVAQARGLRRHILTVPLLTPRLSSYWLYFVTSTSFSLARSLVASMKHPVLVHDSSITKLIPHQCLTFQEAVGQAFVRMEGEEVLSSWKDAWSSGRLADDYSQLLQVPQHGCLFDRQLVRFQGPAKKVVEKIWHIGGNTGWYFGDTLWKIRGFLDQLVGGVGLRRGRRHPANLRKGDALDFWRVLLADKNQGRLLLFAEMKLPGEAWLEFRVETNDEGGVLYQTATFRPRGLSGRIYWYILLLIHKVIFWKMAQRIALK